MKTKNFGNFCIETLQNNNTLEYNRWAYVHKTFGWLWWGFTTISSEFTVAIRARHLVLCDCEHLHTFLNFITLSQLKEYPSCTNWGWLRLLKINSRGVEPFSSLGQFIGSIKSEMLSSSPSSSSSLTNIA